MTNEGYLIGYEDAQGNFVQIGQFNNAADDVTQPLVLRHTNSGETLELDGSSFRPSTQIGDTNNRPDVFADTVDLNTLVGAGLDTKADLTQSGGVLVASQLPDLAITNIDVVADQSARLALNAEEGDVAIQTDISETFILSTNDPTVDSNWKKVQLDVLGAIDGQTITPAQTGTSSNPTTIESDTVTATNIEAGQIGDSSNRPDVFADTVDANRMEVITESQSGDEGTVSFSGLQTNADSVVRLFLRFNSDVSTGGDLKLRVNGNTGNNYETVFTDGSSTVDDGFIIYSTTQPSSHAMTELTIAGAGSSRIGITGPVAAGQFGRISRTLQSGGIDQPIAPVDSVSFASTQSGTSNYIISTATVAIYQY